MQQIRSRLTALVIIGTGLSAAQPLVTSKTDAGDSWILVQSTTSTKNSGLYDHLLPMVKQDTGITVRVVAVGTGQAIRNARNCDGDVLLVHARAAEERFVAEGYGLRRSNLMYNDFVIVGPPGDPAGVKGMSQAKSALRKIAGKSASFISRGDDSGTHKKELSLWKAAEIDPATASGTWYRETGSGMGASLNVAVEMNAYIMTDRATWIAFKNKRDFQVLVENDNALFNQYGVIPVNPAKCPSVKSDEALRFEKWLLSDRGQKAIATFKKSGKQLFFPNATPKPAG